MMELIIPNLVMELMETYHPPTRTADDPDEASANEMLAVQESCVLFPKNISCIGEEFGSGGAGRETSVYIYPRTYRHCTYI